MTMKKRLLVLLFTSFLVLICGCSSRSKTAEAAAQEAIAVFNNGTSDEMQTLIFGSRTSGSSQDVYDQMGSLIGETIDSYSSESKDQSFLPHIFSKNTVAVTGSTKKTVTLEVIAPNLEGVFQNLPDDSGSFTEEDLMLYLKDFADKAESKTFTVELPFVTEGKEIIINYQTTDFLNAMTGGLISSYHQLYEELLEEYKEAMH